MARVVHAGGAATGVEIERALVEAVQATAASVLEGWFALDLIVEDGRCRGVVALDPAGARHEVRARHILLATGGAGQLYAVTTNPPAGHRRRRGHGPAGRRRGGRHGVRAVPPHRPAPPARCPGPCSPRRCGATAPCCATPTGERFVDELAPRDVVTRAMTARMLEQGVDHLWLDATGLERFDERFPTIAASLRGGRPRPRHRLAADRPCRPLH